MKHTIKQPGNSIFWRSIWGLMEACRGLVADVFIIAALACYISSERDTLEYDTCGSPLKMAILVYSRVLTCRKHSHVWDGAGIARVPPTQIIRRARDVVLSAKDSCSGSGCSRFSWCSVLFFDARPLAEI